MGGASSHEQRVSTEVDDSDDDDSAADRGNAKLSELEGRSDANGSEQGNGQAADGPDANGAFDMSAMKNKLGKRPAAGGKPKRAPEPKGKGDKEKAGKGKKEPKQKVCSACAKKHSKQGSVLPSAQPVVSSKSCMSSVATSADRAGFSGLMQPLSTCDHYAWVESHLL